MTTIWSGNSLDFLEGQVILIDKSYEWSSFDVVKKVRYEIRKKLNIKKIKVGHAGTLDPLATGLLVICTGKYTKKIEEFMGQEKEYTGIFKLGATTPSFDLETTVDQEFKVDHISEEDIQNCAKHFLGESDQVPPIFSAKRINGKRAYEYARSGEEVELKSRKIHISRCDVTSEDFPEIKFKIACSKGTYIRSIARDFGLELDSGAHLTKLRRERIGALNVKNALSIEEFVSLIQEIE